MKKNILLYSLFATLVFVGCKKDDGPIAKSDGITTESVPYMRITKVAGFTADIIPSTLASYQGKIKVELLYSYTDNDLKMPEKVDLVIIKNGNRNDVKVLKAGITTFPSEVTFTGPELLALFGSVVTCDGFTVGYDVYANGGKKYEAWPAGGAIGNGGATGINQPFYSAFLNFNTKVEYVPATYSGTFKVVSDAFEDFLPVGSDVLIKQVSPTSFSFIQPAVSNPIPMVFTVDPLTLVVTAPRQKIGDVFLWNTSYTNPSIAVTGTTSFVSPCTKLLTLFLDYRVDQGGFGAYKLVLQKP